MIVYIRKQGSPDHPLSLQPTCTITELKNKIYEKNLGPQPSEQDLIYQGNKMLEVDENQNKFTLQDYSVQSNSFIFMCVKQYTVYVNIFGNNTIGFPVNPNITVAQLKTLINDKERIPPETQILSYDRQNLEDGKTLQEYNIKSGDEISLARSDFIHFFVKTIKGKSIIINIRMNATIFELKELLYDKEGIPPRDQILIFEGKQLRDDNTLQDYSIRNDSNIELNLQLRGGLI